MKRAYFYVVDVNGRLFLDDLKDLSMLQTASNRLKNIDSTNQYSKVRSIANSLRDVKFLNQFYKRLKRFDQSESDAADDGKGLINNNSSDAKDVNSMLNAPQSTEDSNKKGTKKKKDHLNEENMIIDPPIYENYAKFMATIKKENKKITDIFPFISPCFGEMNLVRSEDENVTPIVFTDIISDPNAIYGHSLIMNYTTALKQSFDPSSLLLCEESGKIYHKLDEHPRLSGSRSVGLLRSHLAQQLSSQFIPDSASRSGLAYTFISHEKQEKKFSIGLM